MGTEPYIYPDKPLVRKHNPQYRSVESYRPWLRDEFNFKCPFSLLRETWFSTQQFEIDHLLSRKSRPDLVYAYDNLIYLFHSCNRMKGALDLPDPSKIALAECLEVKHDGSIVFKNESGRVIVRTLRLDNQIHTAFRKKFISLYQIALKDEKVMKSWFGKPDDTPDLTSKRPAKSKKPLT